MSTVQRVAKNTTVLLAAQIASYLLAFFYMMYTARYLGPASFGILSFALAFTGIFAVFGDLGLRPLTVREVARDKSLAPKYLANVSLMKIILVAITFGLIALTINLMGYPEETIKVVYLLALFVIFQAFTQMFYAIFQAFERMEFQAIGQMLNAVLILGGVISAIKLGFSVVGFASLYVIASSIVLGYSFAVMRLKFSSNPAPASAAKALEFDWSFWKPTMKEALPFGLTGMFGMIYTYIDSVMLSLMQGDAVVGWYNAAYRLILVLLFIPSAFGIAVFPSMSRFYITSQSSLRSSVEKYFKYMVILAVPIGVGTTLLAQRIILLVFGMGYTHSIIALQILIWTIVITFAGAAFVKLFESTDRQIVVAKVAGICMAVNIILNLLLIPRFSYVGASAATVVTEFILVGSIFVFARKVGYAIPQGVLVKGISKVAIATSVMGAFVWHFESLNLLVLVLLAILLYFGVLYIIRGIDKEDVSLFRQVIKPERS